jgi:hypothetical protein
MTIDRVRLRADLPLSGPLSRSFFAARKGSARPKAAQRGAAKPGPCGRGSIPALNLG